MRRTPVWPNVAAICSSVVAAIANATTGNWETVFWALMTGVWAGLALAWKHLAEKDRVSW